MAKNIVLLARGRHTDFTDFFADNKKMMFALLNKNTFEKGCL